jgi:ATP-dependent DNA helicase RecG
LRYKDQHYLRNKHLSPMLRNGLLKFSSPESAEHPNQAHAATGNGEVRRSAR